VRLLLARHGATRNNAEARYTGQSDVSLSPLGERQAEALAERLASVRLEAIVSSDLARARGTAERIAQRHTLPVQLDPNLREIALGAWEGSTYEEVLAREPEHVARWRADPLTVAPPGGETVLVFRDRLVQALDHWQATYPDATVLWVTHGGVIGVLLCHLLGMDLARRSQFRRDNAGLTEVALDSGEALLLRLNDTAHLVDLAGKEQAGQVEQSQVL